MIPTLLFFFATQPLTYWVQPCAPATLCEASDPELADWALKAWQQASAGKLVVTRLADSTHAQIRVYWAGAEPGLYGEARPIRVDGKRGAEVYVRPAEQMPDKLLRETIVYLTCLHETGHALGLQHTADFDDIMYSFQYGGDIPEYFGRYRRKLKTRADIQKNAGMSESDRKHLLLVIE